MPAVFIACGGEAKDTVDFEYDKAVVPMVRTDSVTALISDSGIIRYKIIAKTWDIYDDTANPYWLFPDKFYAEQFDSLHQIVATIEADSVWNFTKQKLCKLRGNVFMKNSLGETFSSNELFWDQEKHRLYSNELVEIKRPGRMTLIAMRFESNEQMTDYTFINARAPEIHVNQESEKDEEEEKILEKEE